MSRRSTSARGRQPSPGADRAALTALAPAFYRRPAEIVARDLLGRFLEREWRGQRLLARLVETEAYLGAADRASHAFAGRRTPRVASMYLAGGHAYVYFVYGMHWCLNVVTGNKGEAGAVLLRAAEVVAGESAVRRLRGEVGRRQRAHELLSGPARLCQGLAIDRELDGHAFGAPPLRLLAGDPATDAEVAIGARIGVAYAGEAAAWPLRFALAGHRSVSRPRPVAAG
ncbi:MAG: DNA-3-methyladenine glycosylase [Thermoanaerobaculia bacterium]